VSLLTDWTQGVHRFGHYLQARWQQPFFGPLPLPRPERLETALRLAGLAIVALGALGLAEMLG
jgi:hypothetical protein